jgi:hypothetical protein
MSFAVDPAADPDFLRRALCYLEEQLEPDAVAALQAEMMADPARRKTFVELCMTRAALIEELKNRDQYNRQIREAQGSSLAANAPNELLNETMVMPAILLPPQKPEPANPPIEALLPAIPVRRSLHWLLFWNNSSLRVAAVVISVLAGALFWSIYHKTSGSNAPANQTAESLPRQKTPDQPTAPPAPETPAIAQIGLDLNSQFDIHIAPASPLPPGPHVLQSGIVQLKLSTGASIVLEAPAQFEILPGTRFSLTSGRLTAVVPHGSAGLTVETPDMRAVDLGTEFAVQVTPEDKTHLEVFRGSVRAETKLDASGVFSSKIVTAAQSVRVKSGTREIETEPATPLLFVQSDELKLRASQGGDAGMLRWQAFSNLLRKDPSLIAYYPFDNRSQTPLGLINRADATAGRRNGTLGVAGVSGSAPRWTRGRWAGKDALQFGDTADTAVTIPGDSELTPSDTISILTWIRRSEYAKTVHLIEESKDGVNCFNLTVTGTAGKRSSSLAPSAIYFNYGVDVEVGSPSVLPVDNRWFLLGLVRGTDGTISMYLDGQLQREMTLDGIPNVRRDGDLWIGRSNPAAVATDRRDIFRGQMDELAIFHRELSPEEVERFYTAGKPE